ncbi:MAG: lipopolysaccharide biosynthesis protein [Rikenellaceae bacterium]|nr:lipopolysaccharide biosynthesis protein [Rikenellaceae bacterium]
MDQIQNQNNFPVDEQEIDLVELIQRMWINRGLILKLTVIFMVVGVFVALFSSKVYTASCDVVPQTSDGSGSSKMSSLAALAGINLNQSMDVKALSPLVYENILRSTTFRKELMQTPIEFEKAGKAVSFYEYYTSKEYNKPSVLGYIKKYTIGLPFVILNAIRGEQELPQMSAAGDAAQQIESLTEDEYKVSQILSQAVTITLTEKKGYVTITANMPEAVAAAQLAQATLSLLQKYITEFKIDKVQSNLDFVQSRYDEAKKNFEDIQFRRAKHRDANQNVIKHSARVEQEKLDAEYTLAMTLYTELAKQLEQAKISVKETAPILTVINPVTIPYKKTKPQRAMILLVFTFLGVAAGAGLVLGIPALADITGNDKIRSFVKELPKKEDAEA